MYIFEDSRLFEDSRSFLNLLEKKTLGSQFLAISLITSSLVNILLLFSLSINATLEVEATQSTGWINASGDLMVLSAQPSKNHDFRRTLGAGEGNYFGTLGRSESYAKFNYNLPSNAIVESATLKLRRKSKVYTNNFTSNIFAGRATNSWSQYGTTWNNKPDSTQNVSTSFANYPNTTDATLNVTDIVRSWQSGSSNHGFRIYSTTNGQGAWICSIRNNRPTGTGGNWNNCVPPQLEIKYIINSAPNQPLINTPDAGMKLGGQPYKGADAPPGLSNKSNPTGTDGVVDLVDPKDCVENSGCSVRVDISNIWDENKDTSGELQFTRIDFNPVDGKGQFERVDIIGYQPDNRKVFTKFIKDGKYNIIVTAYDKKGLSNSITSKVFVDTTNPESPMMQTLPEFSKGDQLEVFSNPGKDVQNLSEPITYDFCRADNPEMTKGVYCSSTGTVPPINPSDPDSITPVPTTFFKKDSDGNLTTEPYIFQETNSFGFGNLEEKTYYYAVRHKDNIGNITGFSTPVSSTQDATLPTIQNLLLNNQDGNFRLSPQNEDTSFDTVTVDFDFTEKNPKSARFELINPVDDSIVFSQELTYTQKETPQSPCQGEECDDSNNSTSIPNQYTVSDSFNGKDNNGNWLADGAYKLKIILEDKAGNIGVEENRYIVIDNTPGKANITTPKQNTFTNQETTEFSGQVISDNSVRLFIQNDLLTQNPNSTNPFDPLLTQIQEANLDLITEENKSKTLEINLGTITEGSYLFNGEVDENLNTSLSLGQNLFTLKTLDSVDNIEDKQIKITREEEKPVNTSASFDTINFPEDFNSGENSDKVSNPNISSNYTPADSILTKNRRPQISINLEDPNTQGYGQAGIDKDSINLKLYDNKGNEQILVTNGGSYTNPLINYSTTCQDTSETEGSHQCTINLNFTQDLQPDGEYYLKLDFKDRAGNYNSVPNKTEAEIIQTIQNSTNQNSNQNSTNQNSTNQNSNQNSTEIQNLRQTSYSFYLDSYTKLQTQTPINNNLYARKNLKFSGVAERGGKLKISNTNLNKSVEITLEENNNNTFGTDENGNQITETIQEDESDPDPDPTDSFVQSAFQITCTDSSIYQDFDNSELTPIFNSTNPENNETCKWEVTLNQENSNTNPGAILNENIIQITDDSGNKETKTINTQVDLFAVDITLENISGQFISADGNERQDDITFNTTIQNPSNPEDQVLVKDWTLKFYNYEQDELGNKTGNRNLVRTIQGSNSYPNPIYFDGKTDANQDNNNQGNWIPDGDYDYELDLNTTDNPNLPLIIGTFKNITKNTLGVFVTYPYGINQENPFITTEGVINVQGQANLFVGQNTPQSPCQGEECGDSNLNPTPTQTALTYEDIQVRICVDTIGIEGNCDFERIAEVDESGFFTNTVNLTRLAETTNHRIYARIIDKFGNESELSNTVHVRTSTLDPFKSIEIVPVYSGANKPEQVQELKELVKLWKEAKQKEEDTGNPNTTEIQNLELAIQEQLKTLRQLKLKSTVSSDTQFVKFKFSDLTNVTELGDQSDPDNPINQTKQEIGWIDNSNYDYFKHSINPIPLDNNQIPQTSPCNTTECTWTYDYAIPNLNGGFYQVDFTGRKGGVEQTMTAGFTIDNNILITPTIFDINKILTSEQIIEEVDEDGNVIEKIVTNQTTENTREYQKTYYTNTIKNEIIGFANPETTIKIKDELTNQIICETQTSSVGIFTCILDLPIQDPINPEQNLEEIQFQLSATATLGEGENTKIEQTEEVTNLFYDVKAPELTQYENINNNHSDVINQYLDKQVEQGNLTKENGIPDGFYRQGGDTVEVRITANEDLAYGSITNKHERFRYEQVAINSNTEDNSDSTFQSHTQSHTQTHTQTQTLGYFQVEGYADEGNYQVEIEISDRAGNKTNTTANYFVDNQISDIPLQNKYLWGAFTGFDRRALEAVPDQETEDEENQDEDETEDETNNQAPDTRLLPAYNRLLQSPTEVHYAIKDDEVIITGEAEEGTYPILIIDGEDYEATETSYLTCNNYTEESIREKLENQKQAIQDAITEEEAKGNNNQNPEDNTNQETIEKLQKELDKLTEEYINEQIELNQKEELTAPDGSITKSSTHCQFQFTFNFNDYQTSPNNPNPNQNPQKPYRIQLALEDKSGNRSPRTISYFIEHDKTKPNFFSINNAKNPRRNTLVDWRQDGAFQSYSDGRGNLPTITNQIDLTLEASTEQLADIEYYLINPRGETKDYQRLINTNNQKHSLNLKLGDKTADRDGQAGLEQDGYYQVLYRSGDSADNETELKTLIVERDTLTPQAPNLSTNLNFSYKSEPYFISGFLSGEPYTNSSLFGNIGRNGQRSGTLKTLSIYNDSDWERTFTFCSNLSDRATNTSSDVCRSVRTPPRPPRPGECNITDSAKDSIRESIEAGVDENGNQINPINPEDLGFSRSCGIYEPNLISQQIQDQVDKVVTELEEKARAEQERQKIVQDEKLQEIAIKSACLTNKLEEYQNNKGGSNTSQIEFDNWATQCGASDEIRNLEVDIQDENGNNLTLEEAFKNSVDGIKEQNKRGTMEGCKWATWPWAEDSCVSNGVGEIVHHTSEFVGEAVATIITPTTSIIETTWESAVSGDWSNFGSKWIDNHDAQLPIIKENIKGVTKNTVHGIGRVVEAGIGLQVNIFNAQQALSQTVAGCIMGQECNTNAFNQNYDQNTQLLQDTIGWNGGDWLDNVNIAAGVAVTALGAFIGGPWGAVVAGALFSYTLGSAQKGSPLTLNEFACEGKQGFDCAVNFTTNTIIDYATGKILDSVVPRGRTKPKPGIDIDTPRRPGIDVDAPGRTKRPGKGVDVDIDANGNPCLRFSSLRPNSLFQTVAGVFSPVRVRACGGGTPKIHDGSTPILKNGYVEVNGIKFTEY
ncbi:MAG: DNRLRE domain-containing protein, partial [Saprospiraceae bacterium]|nr:DNRLRE domain-containing protein [Saprospiraceae bacterium]